MIATKLALLAAAVGVKGWYFPPQAPGVINPLGKGQDPAPVRWYNQSSGENVYLFPDIDFGYNVYLRASANLSDVQYDQSNNHTVFTFNDNIATEAPDLSQTADGHWVMYISAVQINTIFVIRSDSSDPLGSWTAYGTVRHEGIEIEGYDAHSIVLPSGDRYLAWSTSYHAPPSISLIKLANITHAEEGTALSAVIVPDQPYEQNAFPTGNYSYDGFACCSPSPANPFNAPVLEAPCSYVQDQTVGLCYSANNYADATYNVLCASASVSADLLDPSSWTKNPYNPIVNSDFFTRAFAPGSGGFFTGPDDGTWFAYGAVNNASGFAGGPNIRTVRAQAMGFDEQGRVKRTSPINATRSIEGDSYADYA